jgi:hypothetical protein
MQYHYQVNLKGNKAMKIQQALTSNVRFDARLSAYCALLALALGTSTASLAEAEHGWEFGAVLDAGMTSRALALGSRDQGLQLGHSDLTMSGPLGKHLKAQLSGMLATEEGKLEKSVEEAWLETSTLPYGLQLRGGRFASQIGNLNQQHPHADDFVERPLLYRAFLGGHWNDDGLRLNWTAPTDTYLMFGVEGFRGKRLVREVANNPGKVGVTTWVAKVGDDLSRSQSWQLGLSHIRNERQAPVEEHADHDEGEEHAHSHGAKFSGGKTWLLDATWKWAPQGNNKDQQLRVTFESARIYEHNSPNAADRHRAHALALAWRLNPSWEVGARTDWLRVNAPEDESRLREHALMLAWKPSHMQTLRLQYTTQRGATGDAFADASKRSVQLQYVLAFGAHGAHAF